MWLNVYFIPVDKAYKSLEFHDFGFGRGINAFVYRINVMII